MTSVVNSTGTTDFYPRSPCGERLLDDIFGYLFNDFYPRSPCGERQCTSLLSQQGAEYFYPRSPCGERLQMFYETYKCFIFLSTLSLRRATKVYGYGENKKIISIHALLAESDVAILYLLSVVAYFYPRSPCGERLKKIFKELRK